LKAKYQVYRDLDGKYRFRLRAANNKIVAVSEAYQTKAGCMNGVKSVQKNCESHVQDNTIESEKLANPKYEVFTDAASKFRFHLKASNGEIIAASEGYETKEGVLHGIDAVQKSCDAEIEDLTGTQPVTTKIEPTMAIEVKECAETTLILDSPPMETAKGSVITFTGKLVCGDQGISGQEVRLYDSDRSHMIVDFLASDMTAEDGTFSIDWKARETDWFDNTVEIYALFKGTKSLKLTRSNQFVITIT